MNKIIACALLVLSVPFLAVACAAPDGYDDCVTVCERGNECSGASGDCEAACDVDAQSASESDCSEEYAAKMACRANATAADVCAVEGCESEEGALSTCYGF